MTMPYRLAAFDLDGTLLHSGNAISEGNVRALHGLVERGVVIVAATARAASSARRQFEPHRLNPAGVFCAGGDVRLPDRSVVRQWPLAPEFLDFLAAESDRQGWITTLNGSEGMIRRQFPIPPALVGRTDITAVANLTGVDLGGSLSAIIDASAAEAEVRGLLSPWAQHIQVHSASSFDGSRILTLTVADTDKGVGLLALCAALGIGPAECVAFGDDFVDLPMFEVAGLSVAVANGSSEVQARADMVTGTNDEDGVAAAIARIWPV